MGYEEETISSQRTTIENQQNRGKPLPFFILKKKSLNTFTYLNTNKMAKQRCVWLLLALMILLPTITNAETYTVNNGKTPYQDITPTITSSNTTYDYEANGNYQAYFNEQLSSSQVVSFTKDDITISLQPHALNYNNDLSQIQQINMPQSVNGATTQQNKFTYQNAYGPGINLEYELHPIELKEYLIINDFSNIPTPAQYVIDGGNPVLELTFIMSTNAQHISIEGVEWDKSSTVTTTNNVEVKDDQGNTIYYLPTPIAIDNNGIETTGSYLFKKSANKLYIATRIPYSFLQTAAYPVTIDPTFYLDYTPIPGRLYDNGDSYNESYTGFDSPTDVTTTISDGNTETRVDIEKKAFGDDKILRAMFSVTYQTGSDYFIRFYKHNNNPTTIRIFPHVNDTHINNNIWANKTLSGPGWYEVNVTNITSTMQSLNHSEYRLIEETDQDKIEISELLLRMTEPPEDPGDITPPNITGCQVINQEASCEENITFYCIITDETAIDYAQFTIEKNGAPTNYIANKNIDNYTITITNTGYDNNTYELTQVLAKDSSLNTAINYPNITANYFCELACEESWIPNYEDITLCEINNTKKVSLIYTDENQCGTIEELPTNNGTIQETYCNYCDPLWIQHTGGIHECQLNNTRYVEYYDDNYCYAITGLIEDEPPYDHQTWQPCNYLSKDFTCYHSDDPYIKEKMDYSCTLPYRTEEWECTNQVIELDANDILQVNPQKNEKAGSLISFNNEVETRTSFTTTNGLLNAYFTNKNMDADNNFMVRTICRNNNETLTNEHLIIPEIRGLSGRTGAWGVYIKENMGAALITLLVIIILLFFAGFAWKKIRGR
jgi:hypothetical protein